MLLFYTYDHDEGSYLKGFHGLDCNLKSVVKTQSRRQSVLVCSLLVVSLLLSAAVGEEGKVGRPSWGKLCLYVHTNSADT